MAEVPRTPFASRMSHAVGWLADRRVPTLLRTPVYATYCLFTGADASEAQLPRKRYPSLSAFFVRRLRDGARPLDADPQALLSPCDGTLQSLDRIDDGTLLQAKGRSYPLAELLAGAGDDVDLDGATAWTIYLGPRDYHRVHSPIDGELSEVRWIAGARYSVHPRVLSKRARVLSVNERAVLRLETPGGPWFLVMVGAMNVGRIRVVGVEQGATPERPLSFRRGDELARFEMGSTVVLVAPRGLADAAGDLTPEQTLRLGARIGSLPTSVGTDAMLSNAPDGGA